MKTYLLIVSFFFTSILLAQTEIKGTVSNSENTTIDFYDLIITDGNNSTIESKTFYEKNFSINANFKDSAIILINAIGYKTFSKTIKNEQSINLGDVKMESFKIKLKAVEIKGIRKKAIERVNGNIVINVANSSLENEVSVADVLKKSSSVIINPNGDINVIGKGNKSPLIVIDDIESDKNALDNLQPSQIKSIEIIKNPSAIYSANATSVIKVTTYNGIYKGWNVKLSGQVTKATFFRYFSAINLGYNHKKYGFDMFYGYNPYVIRDYKEYERTYKNTPYKLKNILKEDYQKPNYHDLNLKFYYKFSDKTTLQLVSNNNLKAGKDITENRILIEKDSILESIIKTDITENNFKFQNDNTLNLIHKIDTNGFVFKITSRFLNLNSNGNSTILQEQTVLYTANTSSNNLFSLQPTILYEFKKSKIRTTTGIRFETINVNSSYLDIDNSKTESKIQENIAAAFINIDKNLKKFDFSAGLRFEYANSNGKQNDSLKLFDRSFYNVFPNASIQYNFAKDWQLYTSYSYKIERPGFGSLSAFNSYLDTLSSFKGNAKLLPEFTHMVDLGVSYLSVASIDLSYSVTKNPLTLFVETEENTIKSSAVLKNLDKLKEFSASLTIPYQTNFWTTYNIIGYSHQDISSESEKFNLKNDMFYFIFYNELNYKKYISINGSFNYFTKGMFDIYTFKPYYTLSLGLKSSLLKNRLQIYVQWNDILRSEKYNLTTTVKNVDLKLFEYNDSNLIRVGFTLKLNNAFKRLNDIDDENNNIDRFKD